MTTEIDIPNTNVAVDLTTAEIPTSTPAMNSHCNIKEASLFNWINLHFNIATLEQFKDIPTLSLFIQALFNNNTDIIQSTSTNHLDYIPLSLKKVNSIIPINTTEEYENNINIKGYLNGEKQAIIHVLSIIQAQYQLYTINHFILQKQELSFTSFTPHFIPSQLNDVRDVILQWSNYVLSDYMSASIIPPLIDLTISSWQNGVFLLALLHYHNPSLVSVTDLQQSSLSTAFQIAIENHHIPISLFNIATAIIEDKEDESFIRNCLVELAACLMKPTKDEIIQRHRDIERFKNGLHHPAAATNDKQEEEEEADVDIEDEINTDGFNKDKSTTFTSTFTLQQLKLTKTTVTRYSDGTEVPTDLEDFESRASTLLEKMNALQHRLILIVPTRRSSAAATSNYSPSSLDSNSMEFFLTDDNTTTSTRHHNDNSSHTSSMISDEQLIQQQQRQLVRLLHPLQAAEEDYSAYDRNFKFLQSEFQALTDGDLVLLQTYLAEELKSVWQNHPKVLDRKSQILNLHNMLSMEFERSETTLEHFRRGFAFARMCSSIRHELDLVQNKMVKSITTHHDIQELEFHMEKTTGMVDTLKTNFGDLLLLADKAHQQETEEQTQLVPYVNTNIADASYLTKYESISSKNELVKSWVEEVRVWFTEAERIRQWIELRIEQLNSTTLPADPLSSIEIPATRTQVEAWNATHSVLEKEIELFDKEDMTRLRSHVKELTSSGRVDKDLSPADTTTIEITLTTLMTLDKLMHSLRRKSYDLQVLTQRVIWEEEYVKAMDWLKETDDQVDTFLKTSARWTSSEEEAHQEEDKRERLMAKEKQKEIIVQQLLTLERKMAEFDQGQFTKTVDSFQDLDNTSSVELPAHLESRQDACEQCFEDLMKRMTFARNIVEQRLNVMDFLYQTELVGDDVQSLKQEIGEAEQKAHPGDNDRDMTARVQTMHERIVQLVTVAAARIPYPVPGLAMDKEPNNMANEEIGHVVTNKRNQLVLLSEDLDERLHGFRNVLQLHRRAKEHLDDATRLCDWAEERVKSIRKAKINLQDTSAFTVEDLQRLERDRDNIVTKKNGKENNVVDLLTSIQLLLETGQNVSSLDREGLLVDASQQLEETFDRLQQVLEEHGLDLEALRKRMQDGNTYFENARSLRTFMNETRHSMPALKQTCGFMTGQSEQQDKRRFEMLEQALNKINTNYQDQQVQFAQLVSHFSLMEPSKIENMEEMTRMQSELEDDWRLLGQEIQGLDHFSKTVGEWYDRQRRLSMVENELIAGLNEEITQLAAKSGAWTDADLQVIQTKIDKATSLLKETGDGIHAADNKQDPLQTANYSCARDRHSFLLKKVHSASNNLNALKNNANQAIAYSAFLGESDKLFGQVQQQKEIIGRRMSAVGESGFACQPMGSIDTLCRSTLTKAADSERDTQQLAKKLEGLMVTAKELESDGYDSQSVYDPIKRIRENLNQLSNTINLEKKQAMFIRKIHIHAKAANDLQTWIDHCSNAITNLPTDVCMTDEQELVAELDNLEQKMIDMRPTIQAFGAMPSRIFAAGKDGLPLDLCEISLDPDQIKQAVNDREAKLLKSWQDLKKQHQQTRQSVESSKRGVDIARKVKSILTQVGDMKDRVSAVRICRNTHLDEGIENRDLKTVLSCPLTSMPNEHRLASAKAELTILDRDMEANLQPSIQELDTMLNKISQEACGDDIFSGQREEISIAVRGLMDLAKSKRRAITEAEKLEDFLTVMEEVEVLLLAVVEVVSRADLSNARMVDGQYSRTDLQALLIDLDTRYRYYEPKINELLDELKEVGEKLMNDQRVVDCIKQFSDKWIELQAKAAAKKADLMERIGPLGDTFDALNSYEGMLQERGRRAADLASKRTATPVLKQPPSPKTMQSTPRYMTGYTRTTKPSFTVGSPPPLSTAARANAKRSITASNGTVSPTARRVAVRQMVAQQQRQRNAAKTPETYVADPKNDLDVALGDIVNDSPYKIQVKMVPGEVGKYWFGDVNPKLAYCRILRSRMVMVRVGGGWVELSQFLTDHALLEDGQFVSGARSRTPLPLPSSGVTRDGFLNTTVGRNTPIAIRGNGGMASPTMKESRSTPFHQRGKSPTPFGHGIKNGNKFLVTVDNDGNRVEVKMTKAKSKDTKFITPRRMNI